MPCMAERPVAAGNEEIQVRTGLSVPASTVARALDVEVVGRAQAPDLRAHVEPGELKLHPADVAAGPVDPVAAVQVGRVCERMLRALQDSRAVVNSTAGGGRRRRGNGPATPV